MYFSVSEKVEVPYHQPKQLPATVEMRKQRSDCHFKSICESCMFLQTTLEFQPTLRRQRDDAAAKGQVGRQKVSDGLLDRLDAQAW